MNQHPVIVGAGAAGLMAALCMTRPVTLLCAGTLGTGTASGWAQGGLAAAIGADDSATLHAADTIAAGAGLCDVAVVAQIVAAGPWAVEFLLRQGAKFARHAGHLEAHLELGLEAAHRRRRIVHSADATGAEIMRVLLQAVRDTPSITVLENAHVAQLMVRDHVVQGLHAATPNGPLSIATSIVVLATGGVGGLFQHTTNPLSATGSGLALAARAGAKLRDMEFVQFHPTALGCGLDPMPLVSEAVRGEGAVFVDEHFVPFMNGNDLAARDIVARAVAAKFAAGGKVFLDARQVSPQAFPGMFAACRANGIEPITQPIPVRPAAHYHMGGIAVDASCESNVSGLFACGEAAATGLHGANRLASNSLLEAMVSGRIVAEACNGRMVKTANPLAAFRPRHDNAFATRMVRKICSENLGLLRNAAALSAAIEPLSRLADTSDAALVALLIAHAALRRRESRGAHFRTDFAATDPAFAQSFTSHISELPCMSLAA